MIDLYTAPTPNGWKASITLEELQLPYEVHVINLLAGEQKHPDYLELNPTVASRGQLRRVRSWAQS